MISWLKERKKRRGRRKEGGGKKLYDTQCATTYAGSVNKRT